MDEPNHTRTEEEQVIPECYWWSNIAKVMKKEFQNLVGKLAFTSQCVPPACIDMVQIVAAMRKAHHMNNMEVYKKCIRNFEWFLQKTTRTNRKRLIRSTFLIYKN